MEILTLSVAALALLISFYLIGAYRKLQRRLNELAVAQEQTAALSIKRAIPSATLLRIAETKKTVLRIANDGPGEARNLEITLDGQPLADHRSVWHYEPIEVLKPGEHVDVVMVFTKGTPSPPFEVLISWTDDYGKSDPPYKTTVM